MEKTIVMVVDDDEAIVSFLTDALEAEGYEVLSALNDSVLPLARDRQPRVILLDILMPVMDGVELSRRLHADPRTAAIPIIAMSATERLVASAAFMAADDRLAKPFRLQELYRTVGRWAQASA